MALVPMVGVCGACGSGFSRDEATAACAAQKKQFSRKCTQIDANNQRLVIFRMFTVRVAPVTPRTSRFICAYLR